MKKGLVVIGLTGATGSGKSAAAEHIRKLGIPVFDADAAVHAMLAENGAIVRKIAAAFPDVVVGETVDRQALGKAVFSSMTALRRLEKILHPEVRKAELAFIRGAAREGTRAAVLEIPLLFETGADALCDAVICLTAPLEVRRRRVMKRPGMTAQRFRAMQLRQMPDALRRRRATHIVHSDEGLAKMARDLERVFSGLIEKFSGKPTRFVAL